MTKRRPIIAAAFALATLAGGVVAASSVGAQRIPSMVNRSTTTKPRTVTTPMPTLNTVTRTKNAALPTTVAPKTSTTKPRTVTTPMPTLNTITRTKNAALPTTTVAPKGKGKGKGKATITMPAYGG